MEEVLGNGVMGKIHIQLHAQFYYWDVRGMMCTAELHVIHFTNSMTCGWCVCL